MMHQEAESIVLALGPRLEWTSPAQHGNGHCSGYHENRLLFWLYRLQSRKDETYIIMYRAHEQGDWAKCYVSGTHQVWRTDDLTVAKRACEIYAATGHWQLSP